MPRQKGIVMRRAILERGHGAGMKVRIGGIRAVPRLPVPDAVKVNRYRPDFYGTPMRVLSQEAMRWPFRVVGRRPRADGCVRVADQSLRSLHEDARRGSLLGV